MENHKTIEEEMNIAKLHTARPYKYAYINILWVFAYFNCAPPFPPRCALYIFEGINQLQSPPSFPLTLAQNTCHTSRKCQTHVEGANTNKQYEKLMKTQNENESARSKTCETQTGNMPRSEKNMCRTLENKKK